MTKARSSTIASRGTGGGSGGNGVGGSGFGDANFGDNSELSSGSGAGSGGGGGNAVEDAANPAEELNRRLDQLGTIDVEMQSRTRGQMETVGVTFSSEQGEAQVSSVSGQEYTVDYENETCTCPHHEYTGARCRHLEAVDQAMGIAREQIDSEVNSQQALSNIDEIAEENRNGMQTDQVDDGFFYTDNMDEFESNLRNGVENVDYEYENVLNGQDVTFGIELEFTGGDHNAIARELHGLEIVSDPRRLSYGAGNNERARDRTSDPSKWHIERDGSIVDNYDRGGEIVSPVLKDTPETWRNIEKICEVANRHGATVTQKCGGHVHIGMEPLDSAKQRWKRFFKVMSGYEECVFRAAGGDQGVMRNGPYAKAFGDRAETGIRQASGTFNGERDVVNMVNRVTTDRYYGINLTNIAKANRANTVEFRYFNGSLNPKQIQANIKLASGIMMAARKSRTRDINSIGFQVPDAFKRRGDMVNNYNETDKKSNKKIAEFLDIAFTRKKDKDALLNVFKKTRWRY